MWNLWITARAFRGGHYPATTKMLYPPAGVTLSGHTLSVANGLLAAPATLRFGPLSGYAFCLLTQTLATGLLGLALARKKRLPLVPMFWFACYMMLYPPRLAHIPEHLNLVSTAGFPLVIWGWRNLSAGPFRARDLLLTTSGFALTGYSCLTLVTGLLALLTVNAIASAAVAWNIQRAIRQFSAIFLSLFICAPIWLPLLDADMFTQRSAEEASRFNIAADAFFLPAAHHALFGAEARQLRDAWGRHPVESEGALTIGALGLIALGMTVRRSWKQTFAWLVGGSICALLALGPTLRAGPWSTGIPLPAAVLHYLPGFALSRAPGRWLLPVSIAVAMIVGEVWPALSARRRRIAVALCWLSLFELLPGRWPMAAPPRSVDNRLAALAPDSELLGTWLDIPCHWKIRAYQYLQTIHQRPLLFGFLARLPEDAFLRYDTFPVLRDLMTAEAGWEARLSGHLDELGDLIEGFDIRTIAVHQEFLARPYDLDLFQQQLRAAGYSTSVNHAASIDVISIAERRNVIEQTALFHYYPVAGWHGAEVEGSTTFHWSRGHGSWILIRDSARTKENRAWELTVRGIRPGITAFFSVDGREATSTELAAGWQTVTIRCPETGTHNRTHWLHVTYPQTVSPPGDPRSLAMALSDPRPVER